MGKFKTFFTFFGVQLFYYGFLCWNYRAVALARLGNVFISDLMVATIAFKLISKVAKDESNSAWLGYALGGAVGSVLSVWITTKLGW